MANEKKTESKASKKGVNETPESTEFKTGEDSTVKILAYSQLDKVAEVIAAKLIVPDDASTLVLSTDSDLFSNLQAYQATNRLIELLDMNCSQLLQKSKKPQNKGINAKAVPADNEKKGKDDIPAVTKTSTITGSLQLVSEGLQAISGIFSLFRTEQTIKQVGMVVDEAAIIAAVAGRLIEKNITLSLRYANGITSKGERLMKKLSALLAKRDDLEAYEVALENENEKAEVKELIKLVDEFIKSLTTDNGKKMMTLLKAESLDAQLNNSVYLLLLKPLFAGGDRIETKRNFFADVKISVSGGAPVSFMLLNRNADILCSSNAQSFSGYRPYLEIKTEYT